MKFFDLELGGLGAKTIFFDYQVASGSNGKCSVETFGSGKTITDCANKNLPDSRQSSFTVYKKEGCRQVPRPEDFLK